MSASPRITLRLPDELYEKLVAVAQKNGQSDGICARHLLAKALGSKRLTTMQRPGRKKLSENS